MNFMNLFHTFFPNLSYMESSNQGIQSIALQCLFDLKLFTSLISAKFGSQKFSSVQQGKLKSNLNNFTE